MSGFTCTCASPACPKITPDASCAASARPDAAHVVSEPRRRNDAVLDELHRLERRIEPRENRTRRVTQRPQPFFLVVIETDRDRASHRRARAPPRVARALVAAARAFVASSSMSSTASVLVGHRQRRATCRHIEKRSVEQLAGARVAALRFTGADRPRRRATRSSRAGSPSRRERRRDRARRRR